MKIKHIPEVTVGFYDKMRNQKKDFVLLISKDVWVGSLSEAVSRKHQ